MAKDEQQSKEDYLASVASFYLDENGLIEWMKIEKVLEEEGIEVEKDPRVKKIISNIKLIRPNQCKEIIQLSLFEFKNVLQGQEIMVGRALMRSLIIREFMDFERTVQQIYEALEEYNAGQIKKRGLYNVTGNEWSVSIVSIDGQKISFGRKNPFTLDELCAPLILGLAIDMLGEDRVNNLMKEAPQKTPNFNEINGVQLSWFLSDLAMILMCSLIKSVKIKAWTESMKHDYVLSYIKGLCWGEELRFSNAFYSQVKDSDHKAAALAHFLKAFTKSKSLLPHIDAGLDLLLQLKSMEVTTDSLAMIGAVLANGGLSPFDDQQLLTPKAATALLNAVYCGGLGKLSTMFAIQGGVPGMSSGSGAMLVVIPGVLGMGLFSPRIECCCSARSYSFTAELIKTYGLHPYCLLEKQVYLPRGGNIKKEVMFEKDPLWPIFTAAFTGDLPTIKKYLDEELDLVHLRDHSGLTLLHVAAAHGHLELVKILFCKAPELLFVNDSWCRKASDYARTVGHTEVSEHLFKLETLTRTSMLASAIEPAP